MSLAGKVFLVFVDLARAAAVLGVFYMLIYGIGTGQSEYTILAVIIGLAAYDQSE